MPFICNNHFVIINEMANRGNKSYKKPVELRSNNKSAEISNLLDIVNLIYRSSLKCHMLTAQWVERVAIKDIKEIPGRER